MLNLKLNRLIGFSVFSLVVSGYWGISSESNLVHAQIPQKNLLLAQSQPIRPIEFNNQNYQYYQGQQYTQYDPNLDKYFVYVNDSSSQMLQRVKQIERTAYIRNYNGRNVIQAGVFTGQSNAQRRIKELELSGIFGAGIVNSENREVTAYASGSQVMPYYDSSISNPSNYTNNFQQARRNSYYVVIPHTTNNLRYVGEEIRQTLNMNNININVSMRTQPRGAHIAIGPFSDRSEAEQWNHLLKKSGYGNARVYYGK
ncbi:MAG: hypothetical protein ACKO3K_18875 [Cuspidothrix sp.]